MRWRSARGSERRASRSLDPRGSDIVLVVLGMQSPSLSQTRRRFLLFTSLSRFLAVMNGCGYSIAMQLCPITSSRCGSGFIDLFCRPTVPSRVHCLLTFYRLRFEKVIFNEFTILLFTDCSFMILLSVTVITFTIKTD